MRSACGTGERFVAAFLDERLYGVRVLPNLGSMIGDERARHANRIAEEEPLVENLSRSKRRERCIPGEAEERDSVEGLGARSLVVAFDVLDQRALEIRLH